MTFFSFRKTVHRCIVHVTQSSWVKNVIFVFSRLPGSAKAQVIWSGTVKCLLIAYFIGNISAKKYQNPFMCIKVIASQMWDVFLRHGVYCQHNLWCPLYIHCESIKGSHYTHCRQLHQALTNFHNSFTDRLFSRYAVKSLLMSMIHGFVCILLWCAAADFAVLR